MESDFFNALQNYNN